MKANEIVELCIKHTLYSWAATGALNPLPVARAKGVHFWTPDGKRFLDFNSQLMSVNIGHSHPKVLDAMRAQLDAELLYVHPGTATEPRARLASLLAELLPGDLNTFFFTLGGAEANENAVRAARLYTGRQKVLARYRSYHGGTNLCAGLTGDPRRWANEPSTPGIIHVMDPEPYGYSFGDDEEAITRNNLRYLEETIMCEGPQSIAAMIIEPVTGTNGILAPPAGYLEGLHALLSRHGILLICDEVMAGFGRTGKMFSFEHYGVVPDIVTLAKGLTSSYVPLGCMGVSDAIAEHFRENVFWGGLTYNAHAFAAATAIAAVQVLRDEGMVENAATLGRVMRAEMDRLTQAHPSVRLGRNIGLFGLLELQKNAAGEALAPYNGTHEAMGKLGAFFVEQGLFTFLRWHNVMCNPPLCITEEQLLEGFAIIDRGLEITDAYFEG